MLRFRRACVLATALLVLLAAGTAGAARLGTNGSPTPDSLILAQADVPGTTVAFSGFMPGEATPMYARMFVPNVRDGSMIEALLIIHPDASHALAIVKGLYTYAETSAGRKALGKAMADGVRTLVASPAFRAKFGIRGTPTVANAVVGRASEPAPDTTILPNTIVLAGVKFHVLLAYVEVDRAIDAIELISQRRTPSAGALAALIAKARARMRTGFTVANTAPPTISGTATVGQTLSLDSGNWTGGATDFTYAWQRCAADGSACVPIDAATGATYVVSSADAGSSLRVTVTGTNTVSQAQATSAQTVVAS